MTHVGEKSGESLRSAVWVSAAICVVLVSSLALVHPVVPAEGAPAESVLRIGTLDQMTSLNPFIGVTEADRFFTNLVYDSLTAVDEDLNVAANLATSWYVVPDENPYGSVWQYNLTHNATWHDGVPMTAADVVFTMSYQTGVNYTSMWQFQPYTLFVDYADQIDSYTVRIHFRNLTGDPAACAFGDKLMIPIIPKHIWESIPVAEAGFSFENPWPIGTGPFECTADTQSEFISGNGVTLLKNANYHMKADSNKEIRFDKLSLRSYLEPAAMATDLVNGMIDMAKLDAATYVSLLTYLESHPEIPVDSYSGLGCTSYSSDLEVNMYGGALGTNPLRLDPEVRKAMACAIDKEAIRDWIYKGQAEEGSSLLSPVYGDLYWQPSPGEGYEFNLTRANETLDAAGYEWNLGHTVRVANASNPYYPNAELNFNIVVMVGRGEDMDTANLLKSDWAKVGIQLTPQVCSQGQWNMIVYSYTYDLAMSYWSGDPDPNPLFFVQSTYAIGGWSENAYSSEYYDENYSASVSEMNSTARKQSMANMQRLSYMDAALMTTVYPYTCVAWRTDNFNGWSNWSVHQGFCLDARWGPNPLFFELGPNTAPAAVATVTPTEGDVLTVFEFNASGCTDAEDPSAALEVRWDWNNDGTWDTNWSTNKNATHVFDAGSHTIGLAVRDTGGLVNNTTVAIVVTETVIPEFSSVLIPAFAMIVMAVVLSSLRKRSH